MVRRSGLHATLIQRQQRREPIKRADVSQSGERINCFHVVCYRRRMWEFS